jgi:hypothetical protein
MPKPVMTRYNSIILCPQNATSNLPHSPLRQFDLEECRDQPSQHSNHTNPGSSNHVRIHATHNHEHDTMSTTVMTVLHSVEVVHIPHES